MKVVADSSVIIDYLRSGKGVFLDLTLAARSKSIDLYIPTVVLLELWEGESMNNKSVEISINRLLNIAKSMPLSDQIAKDAGKIIRKKFVTDFIDSVIAATAVYLEAEIATLNVKHFVKVPNLEIYKS